MDGRRWEGVRVSPGGSRHGRAVLGRRNGREDARCMRYPVGSSGQMIDILPQVLEHFERHRQTRFWHKEAGGLLFAKLDLPQISIIEATGPRRSDRRSRYSYSPDVEAERSEIEARFQGGIHFVGCWHTHPEQTPKPSHVDVRNTSECVRRSRHALNGFVMIIVGQAPITSGLFVAVCDHEEVHQLNLGSSNHPDFQALHPTELRMLAARDSSAAG